MSPNTTIDTTNILKHISGANLSRRKTLSPISASTLNQRQRSLSKDDSPSVSSINSQDENLLMSTRHNFDEDSHLLPKLRDTAQKYRSWQLPEPQHAIPTSAVNRAFKDFDLQQDMPSEDEDSVELARGYRGVVDGTPSKLGGSDVLLQLNDSFYSKSATPQSRPRPKTRRSDGPERPSLRKDAAVRRASAAVMERGGVSPKKSGTSAKRLDSSDAFYRTAVQDVASAPASATRSTRVRVASLHRQHPGDVTGYGRASSEPPIGDNTLLTPKRNDAPGTPRSMVNTTANSFALPDISNLTDLIQNGTSHKLRSMRSDKFTNPVLRRHAPASNYANVGAFPMPDDELQINDGLQQAQQRLADEQYERESAERRVTELELEIIELRTALDAQEVARKTTHGDNDDASSRMKWRMEKTKLESSIKTLQARLENTAKRADQTQATIHRLMSERDAALAEVAAAGQNSRDLEDEFFALQEEYAAIEEEYHKLQIENEELQLQLEKVQAGRDESHLRHQVEAARRSQKAATVARKVAASRQSLAVEKEDLRAQVQDLQEQLDETSARLPDTRSEAARGSETARLSAQNEQLMAQLADAQNRQDQETRRWKRKESQLRAQIAQTGHTVRSIANATAVGGGDNNTETATRHTFAGKPVQTLGETELRRQLAEIKKLHQDDSRKWTAQEDLIEEQLERITLRSTTARDQSTRNGLRTVSAPQPSKSRSRSRSRARSTVNEDEDGNSTTDLNLANVRRHSVAAPPAIRHARSKSSTVAATRVDSHQPSPIEDDEHTELSAIDAGAVADLRRRLEEERSARRQGRSRTRSPVKQRVQVEDEHDALEHETPALSDIVSDVDNGSEVRSEDEDETDALRRGDILDEGTRNSRASFVSSSRRRARAYSATRGMTSAFIIPDITLDGAQLNMAAALSSTHDVASCTICQRSAGNPNPVNDAENYVPVTLRPEYSPEDPDCTTRPSQHPHAALQQIIKSLKDENAHYHMSLAAVQRALRALDPAANRRKHEELHRSLQRLNESIKAKETQIYEAFNVLEGVKKVGKKVGFEEATDTGALTWEGFGVDV